MTTPSKGRIGDAWYIRAAVRVLTLQAAYGIALSVISLSNS